MKTNLFSPGASFASTLRRFATLVERLSKHGEARSKFVSLAPTDEADETGVYGEAIRFAINDSKVKNIALTGPYGSGKSSIIQSFLKKRQPKYLHISLAAFVPDEGATSKDVTRQEIERSILQQMLYGADANRLPLSRFKRIQSPGPLSILKSLYMIFGAACLWFLFRYRESIFDGTFFTPLAPSNWENLGLFAFGFVFVWTVLHHFYVASYGVSLKSISLKNVEMRPNAEDQESILNRHLDEIIYFFQTTNYDLVVVEDLDRFNDPEIFTTLREINSLVNENAGVKRTIKFLYALRDDMFLSTERTKFFEFIIPVIPIINSSNSIDMVLEQGKRLELDERLSRQFLREVSRYLNDLRLIQNIFNEYAIYSANLDSAQEDLLNANKLLAVLIYKNVYPKDFEELHRGTGNFAEILNRKDELIEHGEAEYRREIVDLEKDIQNTENQTPSNLRELRQIYAMALIEKLPEQVVTVGPNWNAQIPLSQIVDHDSFEQLIEQQQIPCKRRNNSNHSVDISGFQSEVDAQRTFQQRKAEIERRSSESRKSIQTKINHLRSRISEIRTTKLNQLVRLNASRVENLFESFGENGDLARFLILEGHLDDTYYMYTSLFHSGRLSPNDNKFLIQIRAFSNPEPDFPIDNPHEVIAAMRDEDFRQSYVLNVKIADCLLSDRRRYSDKSKKLFEHLSSNFSDCENFLDSYYASGLHVTALLSGLAAAWDDFVPQAVKSTRNLRHITQLVATLPEDTLSALASKFEELPESVSESLSDILSRTPELEPARLKHLNFEVRDLSEINEHAEAVSFMFEAGLFKLTLANLEFVYRKILGETDVQPLHESNFTTIRATKNTVLMDRVERDFVSYLRNVLLKLPENTNENPEAIVAVLSRADLDANDLRKFLEKQTELLPSLGDVPESLHAMVFELGRIKPTWANCLAFLGSSTFDAECLVEYFERAHVRSELLQHSIPGDDETKSLRLFLYEAKSLSDIAYKEYANGLPRTFNYLPEGLDDTKIGILIAEQKISFTARTLEALAENRLLQVAFVASNIEAYLDDPSSFLLDDEFREELLRSEIDQSAKLRTVKLMDLSALVDLPERAALIGPIVDKADITSFNLEGDVVQSLITHSRPVTLQISLFNKCHSLLSDEEVHFILANLPKPYCEIKTGYGIPRLKNTPDNIRLVEWLDSRDIISSWSESSFFSNDIRVNLYRR